MPSAGFIAAMVGLWAVAAGAAPVARAQQETPAQAILQTGSQTGPQAGQEGEAGARDMPDDRPLEVTIRPRLRPLGDGFMQDGVLATDDGRYFLYTGWFIDRMGERLAPGSLADRALRMGLGDVVLEILGQPPSRDPVFIPDIGLILGGRYRGMSLLQVAGVFDVDLGPTPFPRGGFYGTVRLDAPWSLADQIIGPVDFAGTAR